MFVLRLLTLGACAAGLRYSFSVHVYTCLLPQNQLPTSFLRHKQRFFMVFQRFYHLAFPKNASLKSSDAFCQS